MGVEREQFNDPFAVGSCTVPRVMRGENGQWSVEFYLNFRVKLPDGREIRVTDRHVLVRANEQLGRKPIVNSHICGTPSSSCDAECMAQAEVHEALDLVATMERSNRRLRQKLDRTKLRRRGAAI